jgi:hypothetical protein
MRWWGLDPGDQARLGIDADHDDRLAVIEGFDQELYARRLQSTRPNTTLQAIGYADG